jgi:hypothetical protein
MPIEKHCAHTPKEAANSFRWKKEVDPATKLVLECWTGKEETRGREGSDRLLIVKFMLNLNELRKSPSLKK